MEMKAKLRQEKGWRQCGKWNWPFLPNFFFFFCCWPPWQWYDLFCCKFKSIVLLY